MSTKYTLPSRPTIWLTPELKANIDSLERPISYISLKGTENPDGMYHFRLSMVHGEGKLTSIRLDMRPSYTDPNHLMRGVLLIEYKEYGTSLSAGTDDFDVPVKPGTTAATALRFLVEENHFDQYDFADNGTGCRHWCALALEKLAEIGVVDANVGERFRHYEAEQAKKLGSRFPMPRTEGCFY